MESNNSMLHDVQALYASIFKDLGNLHPSIRTSLELDYSRLLSLAETRGLPLYTITLPDACKWFDKSLSSGNLIDPRPAPFGGKSKVDKRPTFLQGLLSQIFEADGTLCAAPDIPSVISVRQVLLAVKKLSMECEERYTNKSVSEFIEIERSLPKPRDETWDCNVPRWSRLAGHPIWGDQLECDRQTHLFDSPDSLLQLDDWANWPRLRSIAARLVSQLGPFDPTGISAKHGPGAVSDKTTGYNKYDHRFWTERLDLVFPYDWHASSNLSLPEYVSYREFASKMCAVPKTQKGPRLIAAEPTAHQWIQQGIRRWLEDGVHSTTLGKMIDFRSQTPSRMMALEASYTGKLTTVDLSSASDRLTCRLVEFIFQVNPGLLTAMAQCRSRAMVALNGELLLLRKFAGQGSALTFPVQSVVYAILAIHAVSLTHPKYEDWNTLIDACSDVRVFGDDIIIPTDAYPVLARLLESCLLKVNETKSHSSGFFRESCGMDAFMGHNVTPAYFRQTYGAAPENLLSVIEVSNNFHKKGYWHTANYLVQTVEPKIRKKLSVGDGLRPASLFSYCGYSDSHLQRRWNKDYHIYERAAVTVSAKIPRTSGHGEGRLLQYFTENPEMETYSEMEIPTAGEPLSLFTLREYQGGQVGRPKLRIRLGWVPEKD